MNASDSSSTVESFLKLLAKMAARRNLDPEKTVEVTRRLLVDSNSKGLSDENLEELTGIKQNDVRKILRMLYEIKVATYRRGRHPETGSTRYYWVIDPQTVNIYLLNLKKKILDKLEKKLRYEEENTFYVCPVDGSRYSFEEAFDNNFTCPRCGSLLVEYDNGRVIETLRRSIKRLREEIAEDERRLFSS